MPGNAQSLAQQNYPRMAMGADGHVVAYFYNRQIETGGLVTPGNVGHGGITVMNNPIPGAMYDHGGPVQSAPKIYVVLWGGWGSTGDPDGVSSYYRNFIKGVGGSSWMSTVKQYGSGNAPGSYLGYWNDTTDAIPNLTYSSSYQSYLAAEAKRAASHFGAYGSNVSYVIMLPHGRSVYGFGTSYCAWHSDTSATGGTIQYTNFPYMPDAGYSCGADSVSGVKDGVSIVGGHEQAETETDPQLDAWYDAGGNEIGDKCAWYDLRETSFSTGTFPTQPLWSNSANGCVQ